VNWHFPFPHQKKEKKIVEKKGALYLFGHKGGSVLPEKKGLIGKS